MSTLGSMFDLPLHVASWDRPAGSIDYRVTNPFNGPDLVNGGKHRATDVGNTRTGHTVKAPIACNARGLRHADGARGVRFDLGSGVTLELWHLATTLPLDSSQPLASGQACGTTGNSGARLRNGSPMPAHTHIAATRDGVPFDIEPHLPMVERPATPLQLTQEDDVNLLPGLEHLVQATIPTGVNLRRLPTTTSEARKLTADARVALFGVIRGQGSYTIGGKVGTDWAMLGAFNEVWYVAAPLVASPVLTAQGATVVPPSSIPTGITPEQAAQAQRLEFIRGRDEGTAAYAAAGALAAQAVSP